MSARQGQEALTAVDDAESTLGSVAQALKEFIASHQRPVSQSPSKLLQAFRDEKPGQCALLWLLKAQGMRSFDFVNHPTFLKAIAHCLVAEDKIPYLQNWMTASDDPLSHLASESVQHELWRGRILLHTIEAQAYWSEDFPPLDESVNTYFATTRRAIENGIYIPCALPLE